MGHSFIHHQLAGVLASSGDASRLQIIVAPTAGAALSLRTAAARMDVPLVNVEAVTVSGLALHVWRSMKPFNAGRLAMRDRMVLVLASRLRTLSSREADLFRPSLQRVASGIESDRLAGRNAAWASSSARSAIQQAYADLFAAYEDHLAEHDLVDMADVHLEAVELIPQFEAERDLDALLICCETPVLPAQRALLEGLGRMASSSALIGNPELVKDLEGPWAGKVLNEWSYAEPSAPISLPKPPVLQAATRREEVWTVLANIIEEGMAFDDVEMIVSSRETYLPLIDAACRRLGIPTTMDTDSDKTWLAVKGAVSDFLQWVSSGYRAQYLADLLRSPVFRGSTEGLLSARRTADLLVRFQLTPAMLSRSDLDDILDEGARRERISRKEVRLLVSWMNDFRRFVPDSVVHPKSFSDVLRRMMRELLKVGNGNSRVHNSLEHLLDLLEQGSTDRVDASWLASFLLEKMHEPAAFQDFGNGIHVSGWDEAGYGPRQHAFVLGLDDQASGSQPGDNATHVAGLEASRPDGYGRPIPARRRLTDLLFRFGKRLTASLPAWDISASRSLFPGSALVGAAAMEKVEAVRRTIRLDLADAARQNPDQARDGFSGVEHGMRALEERNAPRWTPYDGQTGAVSGPLSLRLSPSRLEQYLACPYRYFLGATLGLDGPPEEGEDWMDRAAEGSILHDLFEMHTRARIQSAAGVSIDDEEDMLRSLKKALERQAARAGVDPDAFLEARFRELAHGVHRYFERERRLASERTPVHAEFSFSDHEGADAEAARYRSGDGEIVLTGRVDRIDRTPSDDWIIVDYKTGKPEGFVPDKLLKLDDKLQWALYAWAIMQVSGKQVTASEYVFTSRAGAGWSSRVAAPSSEQVSPLFDSVLQRMRTGHFIPAPDENKTCTWCDFKAVCGDLGERKAAIQSKFASTDPEETSAFAGWAVRDRNVSST